MASMQPVTQYQPQPFHGQPIPQPMLNPNANPGSFLGHQPARSANRGQFETWTLRLNSHRAKTGLLLRFHVLKTQNGFRQLGETWAVLYSEATSGEIQKTVLRKTHEIGGIDFSAGVLRSGSPSSSSRMGARTGVRMGESFLNETSTQGSIQTKGKSFSWDLKFSPRHSASFKVLPAMKHGRITEQEDLKVTGRCVIDGKVIEWDEASGMLSHQTGPRFGHSWVWAQCNQFEESSSNGEEPFIFEAFNGHSPLFGSFRGPRLSSFYFFYRGKDYAFNSMLQNLRVKSKSTPLQWEFQLEHADLTFRGQISGDHRAFAGLSYEDTNGSLIYAANSSICDSRLLIYRRGKLDSSWKSSGTTHFEVASRSRNPYVSLSI
jgi:hypothetical protein